MIHKHTSGTETLPNSSHIKVPGSQRETISANTFQNFQNRIDHPPVTSD